MCNSLKLRDVHVLWLSIISSPLEINQTGFSSTLVGRVNPQVNFHVNVEFEKSQQTRYDNSVWVEYLLESKNAFTFMAKILGIAKLIINN